MALVITLNVLSGEGVGLEAASGLEPEIEVLQGKVAIQTNRLQIP